MKKRRTTPSPTFEFFGWAGVVLIVGSYALLALGILDSSSIVYHALVLVGSIGVAAISYLKHAYQPAILNLLFAILAIIALARLLLF